MIFTNMRDSQLRGMPSEILNSSSDNMRAKGSTHELTRMTSMEVLDVLEDLVHDLRELVQQPKEVEVVVEEVVQKLVGSLKYVKNEYQLAVLCQNAVAGLLEDNADQTMQALGLINDRTPDTNTNLVVHSLLSALLRASPASLHRLSSSWLKRLKRSILLSRPHSETVAHRKFDVAQCCVCVSAGILQRLLDSRELALEELENFGTDFIQEVITMIDIPKSDDDPTTSDLLLLLATLHTHHNLKPSIPPLIPPILTSLVTSHSLQSLPQVLIFNFNRAADRAERLHYCMLLTTILHDPGLTDFFYTNDLGVLSDIAVRETGNVDSEDEQVHHAYIQLLPAIVKHPMAHLAISSHRVQNVENTLRDICSGAFVKASTRKCAEKALAECRGERVRTPP